MTISVSRKIMLATDLTPAADRAFDRAVKLASEWDAELTVLHVVEASSARSWRLDRRIHIAEREMARLVRTAAQPGKFVHHTTFGDPAERILSHARESGCDFLITGPAHGKIMGEKLLGSTTARMVRRASIPVLAVRRRQEGPYSTIVSAVDFSDTSRQAFETGTVLFPSAQFTTLHAYLISPNWGGRNADRSINTIECEERERSLKKAQETMEDFLASTAARTSTLILEGDPQAVLSELVEKNWPDLVIAGTHGRSPIEHGTIGSVAELYLMTLPCDVLVVPTRQN